MFRVLQGCVLGPDGVRWIHFPLGRCEGILKGDNHCKPIGGLYLIVRIGKAEPYLKMVALSRFHVLLFSGWRGVPYPETRQSVGLRHRIIHKTWAKHVWVK